MSLECSRCQQSATVGFTLIVASGSVEIADSIALSRGSRTRYKTSLLNSLTRSEKRKSLGRIDLRCLSGAHVEKSGIKKSGVFELAATGCGTRILLLLTSGVDMCINAPSRLGGIGSDIAAMLQHLSEGLVTLCSGTPA
jgi:hypothetical protein